MSRRQSIHSQRNWRGWLAALACLTASHGWAASTQNISTSDTPTVVYSVNLTNDTNLDLLIGTGRVGQNNGGVQIAVGAANGVFGAATTPGTNKFNNPIVSLASGQLNTDPRVDVVVGINNDSSIRVLFDYDTGGGDFQSFLDLNTTGNPNSQYVAVADFDGDGLQDIACANGAGLSQTSVITPPTNTVSIFRRTGNGTFGAAQPFGVPGPVSIAVGDINGDGKPDIVTAGAAINGISILQNASTSGAISFGVARTVAVGNNPQYVDLKDMNGDAKLDLLVLVQGSLNVLLGNGDGSFQSALSNPVITGSRNFVVGDLTTDGKPDIVLVSSLGTNVPSIFLLAGNGNGTFGSATEFQVQGVATFAAVGDFNKDNQPDVAATFGNFGTSTVTVRILDPRPVLTAITPDAAVIQTAAGAGVPVTITGTSIQNGAFLEFNDVRVNATTVTPPTTLTATIPASLLANAGKFNVTVTNADASGSGVPSDPIGFTLYPTTVGTLTVTNAFDDGVGSLRFALQAARGGDTINFDPAFFALSNSDAATIINVLSPLPNLDDGNLTVDASNVRVTVNGSGAGSTPGFTITSNGNKLMGLSIVGFTRSGVRIQGGAKTNTIGGSRLTGGGVNGQGLRIGDCGSFGIEIDGAGTDSNVVKGCWVGVAASGFEPQGNIAGIIINNGAKTNTIGGIAAGEENVVSGNSFEGVTVAGTGSDDNIVVNSAVGTTAVVTASSAGAASREVEGQIGGRGGMGNGSSGMFLSSGSQGLRAGGPNAGEPNTIGFNGGNGLEVRTVGSRRNSSRSNRIARNVRGGITLFDNSNDGVKAPVISSAAAIPPTAGAATRGTSRLRVSGSIPPDDGGVVRSGDVEVYSDSGAQGETLIGRGSVSAGQWTVDVDADDEQNINALFTDTNQNSSSFSSFAQPPKPVITSTTIATTAPNVAFTYTITATNTPTSFSATGLPAGLTLNTTTGVISGTPTKEGISGIVIGASNARGTGTSTLTLLVIEGGGAPNPSVGDVDNDGAPDVVETLIGTDPNNVADVPVIGTLIVDKLAVSLNFLKPAVDSVSLSGQIALPAGYTSAGTSVGAVIAGQTESGLVLDLKGVSPKSTTVNVKISGVPAGVAAPGAFTAKVTFTIKKKDISDAVAASGLSDRTTSTTGDRVNVFAALAVTTGGVKRAFFSTVPLTYKAKTGKTGKAAKAKI